MRNRCRLTISLCLAMLSLLVVAGAEPAAPRSGVQVENIDRSVRPQDDFYRYANGAWLDRTDIPPEKSAYGQGDIIGDRIQEQLRSIIDAADPSDPRQRKISALYRSYLDQSAADSAGLRVLAGDLAAIDALMDVASVAPLMARLQMIGVSVPFSVDVHPDSRNSARYVIDLDQSGLGLPDRGYYLDADRESRRVRGLYTAHVARMLRLSGVANAQALARSVVRLEHQLAKAQWTLVARQDPLKVYNPYPLATLASLAPGFDFQAYFEKLGVADRVQDVFISEPSYWPAVSNLLLTTPLATWRAYFRWHLLSGYAPYLGKDLEREDFSFRSGVLRGIERPPPRWKGGVELVDAVLGEDLGRLYVAEHFTPEAKAHVEQMARHVVAAYAREFERLDWMGAETRRNAQDKLAKLSVKVGYPTHWRDYSGLEIHEDDLAGNVRRARLFEHERTLAKLGSAVDRDEWRMTPPTVNAYYSPERNEIVLPAGILQSPFFDLEVDDAYNYGSAATVIGHEISHAFDDYGSQFDGDGNLHDPPGWFTPADLQQFHARARALVAQYGAESSLPGYPVDGELTLGENIADNAGVVVAYRAYLLSLGDHPAPVIDGFSGAQRFFLGYTQSYLGKIRDSEAIVLVKSDEHAPDKVRAQLPLLNMAEFHQAFATRPGDRLYRPEGERIIIW